jgi:hypothetical protein
MISKNLLPHIISGPILTTGLNPTPHVLTDDAVNKQEVDDMASNTVMYKTKIKKVRPIVQELKEERHGYVYTYSMVVSQALLFLQKGKQAKNRSNTINHTILGNLSDDLRSCLLRKIHVAHSSKQGPLSSLR